MKFVETRRKGTCVIELESVEDERSLLSEELFAEVQRNVEALGQGHGLDVAVTDPIVRSTAIQLPLSRHREQNGPDHLRPGPSARHKRCTPHAIDAINAMDATDAMNAIVSLVSRVPQPPSTPSTPHAINAMTQSTQQTQ
ncbi:hypothetical protein CLG94_02460 [Candidatus Methylomirabilis limnetica]|jgi:hypothetical protein|uniref:Uncharacterized protein n=1 Tax=Candidatus Methylomirabilis limnetica TaxID=2033718 RepID=A0A2T4U0G4_9BACT|nr:hypothetical protein [Candidatus Methylomirabilis limnetica]PTL36855.1 hypothetical protein CLG94_02460 [Candidatus Methylomirabilis limnetica]